MIGTKILKIDFEIAEIFKVKVGTCITKIICLPLCNRKMSTSKWWVPSLTSNISANSESIFKIFVPSKKQSGLKIVGHPVAGNFQPNFQIAVTHSILKLKSILIPPYKMT